MNHSKTISEPYRYFFPIGILGAMLAATLWIFPVLIQKGWGSNLPLSFPVKQHFNLFIALFFIPIIQGFAFTAIPRFTGTPPIRRNTLIVFLLLHSTNFVLVFIESLYLYFIIILWIHIFYIFIFLYKRLFFPTVSISNYLYLSVFGSGLALIGVSLELLGLFFGWKLSSLFKHSFIFGFFPLILFSYGSRLIVAITQWDNQVKKNEWFQRSESITKKEVLLFSMLFLFTFLLEGWNSFLKNTILKYFFTTLRFTLLSYWLIRYFHLLEYKKFVGSLSKMVYASMWFLLLGFSGYAYGQTQAIHFAHLYFIGGLFLFTISVMTRVTLSHGGAGVAIERSKYIYLLASLAITSSFARATAHWSKDGYFSHLAYSAIFFITFFVLWTGWVLVNTRKKI
jgi:uncharacterized protein involved in response to NO